MGNVSYKIESSTITTFLGKKYYELGVIVRIGYDSQNRYNITYDDDDFSIDIKTDIKPNIKTYKVGNFIVKTLEDKSLLFRINLMSNFIVSNRDINLKNSKYKESINTPNGYLNVVFKLKTIEAFNKLRGMISKKENPKYYKYAPKPKITKNMSVRVYQGGGCSGK